MQYKRRVGDRKYKNGPAEPPTIKSVPMYNWEAKKRVITCQSCMTQRAFEEFPKIGMFNPDKFMTDENEEKRSNMCNYCTTLFYDRLCEKYGDKYKALYRLCVLNGFVYDDVLAHRVFEEERKYEDGFPVSEYMPTVLLYIRAIQDDTSYHDLSPMDERFTQFDYVINKQKNANYEEGLNEQGRKDRNDIIEKFHYDPFDKEPAVDRNRLYSDLLTLYDDAMASDLVRQRAAIEIVKSFYRIDCIGQTIQELQNNTQSMVDNSKVLKELIDQKKKETDMVTSFSKDHGFAERYQMAKSKGAGTLSSIVRDGFDNHFDRMAVNRFDIETANAMKQVSEISAQAMFSQIQLIPDDFRDMIETQAQEIRNLTIKNEELTEANRILREKHIKQELVEEYVNDLRKKGIQDEEIIKNAEKHASQKTFFDKNGEDG